MQRILITLAALATLTATPVPAHAARAAQPSFLQEATPEVRVENALATAKKNVLAKNMDRAAYNEFVAAVRAGYSALQAATPNATTIQTRLINAIDEIYAQVAGNLAAAQLFDLLYIEAVNARLANAIQIATNNAVSGTTDLGSLDRVINHLTDLANAEIAVNTSANVKNSRDRAKALVEALKKKVRLAAADFQPLVQEVAGGGAVFAEAVLEETVVAGTVAKVHWDKTSIKIGDLADALTLTDPTAAELRKKLNATLAALQTRFTNAIASGAKLSRTDFNELRDGLINRVTAIAASAPK